MPVARIMLAAMQAGAAPGGLYLIVGLLLLTRFQCIGPPRPWGWGYPAARPPGARHRPAPRRAGAWAKAPPQSRPSSAAVRAVAWPTGGPARSSPAPVRRHRAKAMPVAPRRAAPIATRPGPR